jgi:hypothetical protein
VQCRYVGLSCLFLFDDPDSGFLLCCIVTYAIHYIRLVVWPWAICSCSFMTYSILRYRRYGLHGSKHRRFGTEAARSRRGGEERRRSKVWSDRIPRIGSIGEQLMDKQERPRNSHQSLLLQTQLPSVLLPTKIFSIKKDRVSSFQGQ